MIALFIFLIAGLMLVYVFWPDKTQGGASIPEIHKVRSIRDIVMAVNHGRIYPFYTRMNLIRAKDAARKVCFDITKLENDLQLRELMGITPYLDISISNEFIIWREGCMVINIHKEGSLSVIDESLFGR